MRIFWWTEYNVESGLLPVLWSTDPANEGVCPIQSYDHYTDIKTFTAEGAQEISLSTARTLGYPTL